jgi:phenylalanyl-tRNA synthetase alpha chain
MINDLQTLQATAAEVITAAETLEALTEIEQSMLGQGSVIQRARSGMRDLPNDEKPAAGRQLKETTAAVQQLLESRRGVLSLQAENQRLRTDRVDVTLPGVRRGVGVPHLLTSTMAEVVEIFTGLGYRVAEGPEVETAWYNFDALNTGVDHPARAESDTLYVDYGDPKDEMLLRTQTSPMQARYMQDHEPPVYVVVPGRVFRTDTLDPTHSPVFHQIEGLAVDTDITFGDLKGTLAHFAREYFGEGTKTQFLPHFFPFTEPSAEMHVSCFNCKGTGSSCRVCGGAGWIEILGCGMVDPNVFEAVGYDPEKVTGFAFGMGVERLAMIRHGLSHIKHLYENDLRVVRQYR